MCVPPPPSSTVDRLPVGVPNTSSPGFAFLEEAVILPRPKSLASDLFGGIIACKAMTNRTLCLTIIACAAGSQALRNGSEEDSSKCLKLNAQAMRSLNDTLSAQPHYADDATVMAVCLLWYEGALLEDQKAIESHGNTMRALVSQRGGIGNLGMGGSLAQITLWSDVIIAMYLEREPLFEHHFTSPTPLLASPPPPIYGMTFEYLRHGGILRPDLLGLCCQICRVIEVFEKATRECLSVDEYMYFFSMHSMLCVVRPQIRLSIPDSDVVNACVSFAIELVIANAFFQSVDQRFLAIRFCSRIQSILSNCTDWEPWKSKFAILIWVLFVVCTMTPEWPTRPWFISRLRQALCLNFGSTEWPAGWQDNVLEVLKGYAWSEVRFSRMFHVTCEELLHRRSSDSSPVSESWTSHK
jgi:hypothetical protein